VLRAVMTAGTVTGAARLLNVTQPAVTKILQHAEDQLGLALFRRVKGRLQRTPEAIALEPEIERIYAGIDDLIALSRSLRSDRETVLRVGVAGVLETGPVPLAVARIARQNPDLEIRLGIREAGAMQAAVASREDDLVFAFDAPRCADVEVETVAECRLLAAVPADRASALPAVLCPDALRGERLIGLPREDALGAAAASALAEAGLHRRARTEVASPRTALGLVGGGLGIAIVDPFSALAADPERVALRALSVPAAVRLCAVRSARGRRPALERAVTDAVAAAARDLMEEVRARLPRA
jgi:DNA-binding transcriptional LysR family regulator